MKFQPKIEEFKIENKYACFLQKLSIKNKLLNVSEDWSTKICEKYLNHQWLSNKTKNLLENFDKNSAN